METILSKLEEQNLKIERDISRIGLFDDGEICSNIIMKLRTFIEHIAAYHYIKKKNLPNVVTQHNITAGILFVNKDKNLSFISDLHNCLQACASHYVISEITSPRLIQKYLPYLFKIKRWIKNEYSIELLTNLKDISKVNGSNLIDFYTPIKNIVKTQNYMYNPQPNDRYYVNSCHPIIVDDDVIYEITLGIASDFASKFNRFIVFSNEEIPTNYSIRCELIEKQIFLAKYSTRVKILQDWCVSIRPCEFVNYGKLFGLDEKVSSLSPEYTRLMNYLMQNKVSILDILEFDSNKYNKIKSDILSSTKEVHIFNVIDAAREQLKQFYFEKNLIKYLAYNLNNKIIKSQRSYYENNIGLYVNKGTIPFCQMPFAMSLVDHNPSLLDLIKIFGTPREDELVYRKFRNETEANNIIYHRIDELFDEDVESVKNNIRIINNKLSWSPDSKIENVGDFYYIKHNEDTTISIIEKLCELSQEGIIGYSDFAKSMIEKNAIEIDSQEKKNIIMSLFSNTKVSCIYGAAGTGKSYLAKIISQIYRDNTKLYISNTNTAVNNIYRKVGGDINYFMTIHKYLKGSYSCDILFVDECSMVSNDDMINILNKNTFKCLVLMGDIIQIESIKFGNWYKMSKAFLEKKSKKELLEMHRTTSEPLKLLWSKLREKEDVIDEILLQYDMVKDLNDDSLFIPNEDEIVLSLNYNGIYGINNLNNIMQEKNPNESIRIWSYTYKVGDPIIFTDNNQFAPILYNNLNGTILSFENHHEKVTFILSVNTILNSLALEDYDELKLLKIDGGKSIISIDIEKRFDSDKDEDKSKLVPFQIAYSVSIHKSQGLEFKNVKIVISNDVDLEITHNIFYTAVTRSSENLSIFWTGDTQKSILNRILVENDVRDIGIIKNKFKIKIKEKDIYN